MLKNVAYFVGLSHRFLQMARVTAVCFFIVLAAQLICDYWNKHFVVLYITEGLLIIADVIFFILKEHFANRAELLLEEERDRKRNGAL